MLPKKWSEVYDQSERDYRVNKEIGIKTPMLRSDLCDFSDAYIVVKGEITVTNPNNAKRNKAVAFKNNAPFINCISKINGVQIDNAEDLDVVMPMYNLLEYSKNYKKIAAGYAGYDPTKVDKNETEIGVPLKHLSNFWKTLNIPLINCQIELILTWSKNCF